MFPDHELDGRSAGWGGFPSRVVYPVGARRWRRFTERHVWRFFSAWTEGQTTEHERYDGLRVGGEKKVKVNQGRRSTLVGIKDKLHDTPSDARAHLQQKDTFAFNVRKEKPCWQERFLSTWPNLMGTKARK